MEPKHSYGSSAAAEVVEAASSLELSVARVDSIEDPVVIPAVVVVSGKKSVVVSVNKTVVSEATDTAVVSS
jgi:hypothetical protein